MPDPTPLAPVNFRRNYLLTIGDTLRHVAADGGTLVGSLVTAPAPIRITSASFCCAPPLAVARATDLWTAILQVRPAGALSGPDSARLDFALTAPPVSGVAVPLPAGDLLLRAGDVLACGVLPGAGGVLALDCPSFALTWEAA